MRSIVGKLIFLGESAVGKTSIVSRFIQGYYDGHTIPTVGAAYFTCAIQIEDVNVRLQIWDTSGQERFKAVSPLYFRNAQAAVLVFDLTQPVTFSKVRKWLCELQENVEQDIPIFIVGNKSDCTFNRRIVALEGIEFAHEIGGIYFETSAVTGEGIIELFHSVAGKFLDISKTSNHSLKIYDANGDLENSQSEDSEFQVTKKRKKKSKKCCSN